MSVRQRSLPPGWYPSSSRGVRDSIGNWERELGTVEKNCVAGIIPHAGWEFSGVLAYDVMRRIDPLTETIIVIGGHLPEQDMVLAGIEDEFATPLGSMSNDKEVLEELAKELRLRVDSMADNTVEVQLPLAAFLFPKAKLLYLRASPTSEALKLGVALARIAERKGKSFAVLGSTDLTHYGANYGFAPRGSGEDAVAWVRNVNDRRFIDLALDLQADEMIRVAVQEHSACSAGGAAGAVSFAYNGGARKSELIGHRLSLEVHKSDSFVGYGGVTFRNP